MFTPARILSVLSAEIAALGVATSGISLTRLQGQITLAGGLEVTYRDGWLCWPAGRLSRRGRPLYAICPAGDPRAARRIAARHEDLPEMTRLSGPATRADRS